MVTKLGENSVLFVRDLVYIINLCFTIEPSLLQPCLEHSEGSIHGFAEILIEITKFCLASETCN